MYKPGRWILGWNNLVAQLQMEHTMIVPPTMNPPMVVPMTSTRGDDHPCCWRETSNDTEHESFGKRRWAIRKRSAIDGRNKTNNTIQQVSNHNSSSIHPFIHVPSPMHGISCPLNNRLTRALAKPGRHMKEESPLQCMDYDVNQVGTQ
jgi:hypothetical protein